MPQRDPDYPEAATEVAAARRRFKTGDRVKHIDYGWRGVVTGERAAAGPNSMASECSAPIPASSSSRFYRSPSPWRKHSAPETKARTRTRR